MLRTASISTGRNFPANVSQQMSLSLTGQTARTGNHCFGTRLSVMLAQHSGRTFGMCSSVTVLRQGQPFELLTAVSTARVMGLLSVLQVTSWFPSKKQSWGLLLVAERT